MKIYDFISKILHRKSEYRETKQQNNKKSYADEQLKQKLKTYECLQNKLYERMKQLEKKYSLLEKRIEALEGSEKPSKGKDDRILSNVISWTVQQSHEPVEMEIQNKNTIHLSIQSGGRLKKAEIGDIIYYKAWEEKGKLYFVFVNSERTPKAINNRTTIIEPFCDNVGSIKSPDNADAIEIVKEGVLTDDFQVLEKVKIKYM